MASKVEGGTHLAEIIEAADLAVVQFSARWCDASKQMDVVFDQLCSENTAVRTRFVRVEAEDHPEISQQYNVSVVPFFVFVKNGEVVDQLEGANPAELASKVEKLGGMPAPAAAAASSAVAADATPASGTDLGAPAAAAPSVSAEAKARIEELLKSKPVMLFMKGNADEPRCGFSRKVVEALREESVEFGTVDILSDEDVRQGLKVYSNWPTYPQLYHKGELLGGCDVVLEMHKSGELAEALADAKLKQAEEGAPKADQNEHSAKVEQDEHSAGDNNTEAVKAPIEAEAEAPRASPDLAKLVNSHPVMLFMKGTAEEPKCGFSRKVVTALQDDGIPFSTFDILSDEQVRQGLKDFSNWPTFPQLYVRGELMGGCDIVTEMQSSGELKQLLKEKGIIEPELQLKKLITSSDTMLFMKGTPEEPKCGFSRKVVAALKEEGVSFGSFDILSDEQVRQGLKQYSNWPTYPQLYHKGELLGGCDIVLQLKESGELKEACAA